MKKNVENILNKFSPPIQMFLLWSSVNDLIFLGVTDLSVRDHNVYAQLLLNKNVTYRTGLNKVNGKPIVKPKTKGYNLKSNM